MLLSRGQSFEPPTDLLRADVGPDTATVRLPVLAGKFCALASLSFLRPLAFVYTRPDAPMAETQNVRMHQSGAVSLVFMLWQGQSEVILMGMHRV